MCININDLLSELKTFLLPSVAWLHSGYLNSIMVMKCHQLHPRRDLNCGPRCGRSCSGYDSASQLFIWPLLLTVKLTNCGVPTPTCSWILDFLPERPQMVRMGSRVSRKLTFSTGSPQGCCVSPKLFALYTQSCVPPG